MAFYTLEPWGFWPAWQRVGMIAATIANAWRTKGSRVYKPTDFMPKEAGVPEEPQTLQEMQASLHAFVRALERDKSGKIKVVRRIREEQTDGDFR